MKDLFSGLINNLGSGKFLNDPNFIAGVTMINPENGEMLRNAAKFSREQELGKAELEKHELQKAELLRRQQMQQQLPEVLGKINWENPNIAAMQLAQIGVPPEQMGQLFNLYRNREDLQMGREQLGLQKEDMALKKQRLGMEQQEQGLRLQQLQQAMEMAKSGALPPEESRKIEAELRKELNSQPLTREFNTVKSSYNKVKAAAAKPSAANDIGLLYGIMKMYDPGSVVRESEYATAENAAGVPDRIRGLFNKALSGKRLTDAQRKDFVNSAKDIYKAQVQTYKPLVEQYKGLTERYKVPTENVILTHPELEEQDTEESLPTDRGSQEAEIINQLRKLGLSPEEIDAIGR